MCQNGAEQPTVLSVARKAPDSLRVPRNQGNLWQRPHRAVRGELGTRGAEWSLSHEGDEQSGVNWVTTTAHNGHEGKEQSVAERAV